MPVECRPGQDAERCPRSSAGNGFVAASGSMPIIVLIHARLIKTTSEDDSRDGTLRRELWGPREGRGVGDGTTVMG